jgi:SAM-dependent methyltransferase
MNSEVTVIDGIKCFAPELAHFNKDFDAAGFKQLFELENNNFWFRSRNRIIQTLFQKYSNKTPNGKFLEIGCGTGYVLKGLERFPGVKLTGAEIYLEGLKFARMRLPDAEFIQMDAARMPFTDQFDYIGAFDVLEHITEDEAVMKNVFRSLKKDGVFFISVPQYMTMWSYEDDITCHKRRYSKKEIFNKLQNSGFTLMYHTSFVFSLFPLMWISRWLKKNKKACDVTQDELNQELKLNPLINKIFEYILRIDEFLIRCGMKLPFGGSLMVVAAKI